MCAWPAATAVVSGCMGNDSSWVRPSHVCDNCSHLSEIDPVTMFATAGEDRIAEPLQGATSNIVVLVIKD